MALMKSRNGIVGGALVAAVVLGLASVAFACSAKFNGEMKVWGGAGGTSTAIGSNASSMVYCGGWPTGAVSVTHGKTQTLVVQALSNIDGCATLGTLGKGKLGLGDYYVNVVQTKAFTAGPSWKLDVANGDCMNGATPTPRSVGTIHIDNNGNGQSTVAFSASAYVNGAQQAGGICISDFSGTSVMEDVLVFI